MLFFKLVPGAIVNVAIFGVALFLPAGTLHWRRAWLALSIIFIATAVSMPGLYPGYKDLLKERMKPPIRRASR